MLKLINALSFHVLLNDNPDPGGAAPAATPAPASAPVSTLAPEPTPAAVPASPAPSSGPDFLPETYRNDPAFSKYKSQDEFLKGYKNLQELVGKKAVIQGLELPGEQATEEDYNAFYSKLGRPESADKYHLPEDVKLPADFDAVAEKKAFSELAHKAGLTQRQANVLFKEYAAAVGKNVQPEPALEDSLKEAFGDKAQESFELAKKGAEVLALTDKLNSAGLGRNPLVLQLCAKVGELAGEGTIARIESTPDSAESILAEARKLQASPEYKNGDKALHAKVYEMYQKVYG